MYQYNGYDFVSLASCVRYTESFVTDTECTEANRVLKYSAGTPMYWRIVRKNGDGTLRMVYAGTSATATGSDVIIGMGSYNVEDNDAKYVAYTYDRTTTEVKSTAKSDVDEWYTTALAGTVYEENIATGKFCSDTSVAAEGDSTFGPYNRIEGIPTLKCPATTQTYGGSYNLKVGLLTTDEIITAGALFGTENTSFYLYDGKGVNHLWTMSPFTGGGSAIVGVMNSKGMVFINGVSGSLSLRPVINLNADVTFQEGADGSTTTPYVINE